MGDLVQSTERFTRVERMQFRWYEWIWGVLVRLFLWRKRYQSPYINLSLRKKHLLMRLRGEHYCTFKTIEPTLRRYGVYEVFETGNQLGIARIRPFSASFQVVQPIKNHALYTTRIISVHASLFFGIEYECRDIAT